jgi:hypothetical protein
MAAQPTIKNETVYSDGGYVALVVHYGREFAVHYVKGEMTLYATNGNPGYDHRPRWQKEATVKAVRSFMAARIAAQPAEWHAAHAELYGLAA